MPRSRLAIQRRRYPVPANYPLPEHEVPDMPADIFHLQRTGALMASDCAQYGWRPIMCAKCGTTALDLIYSHGPLPLERFRKGVLPGTVHGEDVTAICPRCSFGFADKQAAANG